MVITIQSFSLKKWQFFGLFLFSFFLVTFGQPVWNDWLGMITAIGGYACFFRVLFSIPSAKNRFFIATGWMTSVQIIQFSWFASHPYLYIYGVLLFCSFLIGFQWGIFSLWIKPKNLFSLSQLFALAGLWVLFEWSRLFILSGLPFNPVGLSLTESIYSLQFASVGGIYGLSFWVILTNLLLLRAWIKPFSLSQWAAFAFIAFLPYGFGWIHVNYHKQFFNQKNGTLNVVLVQSALPVEENLTFQSAEEARQFVINEWWQVLNTLQKQMGKAIDLIVLPEYLVPYGTYHHVFPVEDIQHMFQQLFGEVTSYPSIDSSFIKLLQTDQGTKRLVSNAYLAQTLANFFQAHVVIGLEDSLYKEEHKTESYSAAFHFIPGSHLHPKRYEKRVLVPMGEYIPFQWCRKIAAQYGITGSFTCGQEAKVFAGPVPFGTSICYEEIYGYLMRENRVKGAELLVNLTNDGWYPHSRLPKQHFDHARLRTVENGIPLIRACNTGITGAIDSLGQIIGVIGTDPLLSQEMADSIHLNIPLYHYKTLYAQFGDFFIILIASLSLLFGITHQIFSRK